MSNLEELNLSIYNLEVSKHLEVPETLEKLHLKFGGYDIHLR